MIVCWCARLFSGSSFVSFTFVTVFPWPFREAPCLCVFEQLAANNRTPRHPGAGSAPAVPGTRPPALTAARPTEGGWSRPGSPRMPSSLQRAAATAVRTMSQKTKRALNLKSVLQNNRLTCTTEFRGFRHTKGGQMWRYTRQAVRFPSRSNEDY